MCLKQTHTHTHAVHSGAHGQLCDSTSVVPLIYFSKIDILELHSVAPLQDKVRVAGPRLVLCVVPGWVFLPSVVLETCDRAQPMQVKWWLKSSGRTWPPPSDCLGSEGLLWEDLVAVGKVAGVAGTSQSL